MMKKMCILHSCWFHVSSASSPFAQSFVWLSLLRCTSLPHRLNPFLSLNYSCFFQLHLPPVSFPNIPPFSRFLSARSLPWGIHLSLLTWPLKSLPGEDNSCRLPEEILTNSVFCQDDALVRILRSRVCHERKGKHKRTQVNEDIARWKMNCREINHGRMLQFSLYLV